MSNYLRNGKARWISLGLALLAAFALLAGCGGGSAPPNPDTSGRITGQVLDAQNLSSLIVELDGQPLQVTPDSQGNFTIPNVPPGDHVVSILDPTTNSGVHVDAQVGAGQATDVGDLTLAFGGAIAGIVSQVTNSGDSSPMAGVEVVAESAQPPVVEQDSSGGTTPPEPALRLVTFTAEDGFYQFRALPPGEYQVSVVVPGFEAQIQWVWVEVGQASACNFVLRPSVEAGVGTVQGTVTAGEGSENAGAPIVGALVSIYSQSPYYPILSPDTLARAKSRGRQSGVMPPAWMSFATLTDNQGHYSLNVPSGYLTIDVYAEGFEWVSQPITVLPNVITTMDFVLTPWTEPVPLPVPGGSGADGSAPGG